jgi:hypothetical protein
MVPLPRDVLDVVRRAWATTAAPLAPPEQPAEPDPLSLIEDGAWAQLASSDDDGR